MDAREQARRAQARQLAEVQEAVVKARTQLADRQARLAQVDERRAELGRLEGEEARAAAQASTQTAELETQLATSGGRLAAANRQATDLERERQAQARILAEAQEAERTGREQLGQVQRVLARLQDQQELLARAAR